MSSKRRRIIVLILFLISWMLLYMFRDSDFLSDESVNTLHSPIKHRRHKLTRDSGENDLENEITAHKHQRKPYMRRVAKPLVIKRKANIKTINTQGADIIVQVLPFKSASAGLTVNITDNQGDDVYPKLVSEIPSTSHVWPFAETKLLLERCKKRNFYAAGDLPQASIIITFMELETLGNILRLVRSIRINTPKQLVFEVLLINDGAKSDSLTKELRKSVPSVAKGIRVRIYELSPSVGLIQARLKGAELSRGDVLVFLDSHMEVQKGWLEPLLYEIKVNSSSLAAGHLDWMTRVGDDTWEYKHGSSYFITVFDWALDFQFQSLDISRMINRQDPTSSFPSPIIMGANYAIDRKFFFSIGAYDEGMLYWGTENIDISIRTWCCGGRILVSPCSHVGHVEEAHQRDYRVRFPSIALRQNTKRLVDVWFDDFKDNFYNFDPKTKVIPQGDISSRKEIKERCPNDFSWYLTNVHHVLDIPQHGKAWGNVRNNATGCCLHSSIDGIAGASVLCQSSNIQQWFTWNKEGELRESVYVMMVREVESVPGMDVHIFRNNAAQYKYGSTITTQKWNHTKNGELRCLETGSCLEMVLDENKRCSGVLMKECSGTAPLQQWSFDFYTEDFKPP